MPEGRSALLLGATGLIGSTLLSRLLASPVWTQVSIWTRAPLGKETPKLRAEVVDFERLRDRRIEADDVFCCLGTTIGKAGSREAFRRVDLDYPAALARAAARDGARRLLVVSALGANACSKVFYNRVKGEMEDAVRSAGVARTYFFRPSLLAGPRAAPRTGERIGLVLGVMLGPLLGKYRPVHADWVAAAMLHAAQHDLPAQTFESPQIRALIQQAATR